MSNINNEKFYQKDNQNQKRIIEKYSALHDACCQYSNIAHGIPRHGMSMPQTKKADVEKDYADDGFIEIFCK